MSKTGLFKYNGLDHAMYAAISYAAVYFAFGGGIPITICFAINTVYWFMVEALQERKMVKNGRRPEGEDDSFNPFRWSRDRLQDFLYPAGVGLLAVIIL